MKEYASRQLKERKQAQRARLEIISGSLVYRVEVADFSTDDSDSSPSGDDEGSDACFWSGDDEDSDNCSHYGDDCESDGRVSPLIDERDLGQASTTVIVDRLQTEK